MDEEAFERRWVEESTAQARERARVSFEASLAHAKRHMARGEIVCDCEPPWGRYLSVS